MPAGVDRGDVWPPPKVPDFSMEKDGPWWVATTLVGPGYKVLCSTALTRGGAGRRHRRRLARLRRG